MVTKKIVNILQYKRALRFLSLINTMANHSFDTAKSSFCFHLCAVKTLLPHAHDVIHSSEADPVIFRQ